MKKLNVLAIGLDKSLFSAKSGDVLTRQIKYASDLEELIIIVLTLKKDKFKEISHKNIRVIPTNSISYMHTIPDSQAIADRVLINKKIDVVTAQDPFPCGVVARYVQQKYSVPFNLQIHTEILDNPYFRREKILNRVIYTFAKKYVTVANSIRVVSPHSLKFIRKKYHLEPYFIPVSTNVDFFISPKNIKRKKIILCVGRMVKQKNFELLIEVFREVVFLDKRADFNLMFVGEGDTKTELEKKVKKYNLSKKVLFLGNKNHDEVKKIMQTSMIFVLPSLHEGWGLVAIEAMAAGLPIVMTKTGCADYAVINKKNGFIVPINDKKALRKAILNLIDNPKLIRKISSYNINKTKKIDTEKSFRMWIECLEETAKIKVEKR